MKTHRRDFLRKISSVAALAVTGSVRKQDAEAAAINTSPFTATYGDPELRALRDQFPLLGERVNGHPLSTSTAPPRPNVLGQFSRPLRIFICTTMQILRNRFIRVSDRNVDKRRVHVDMDGLALLDDRPGVSCLTSSGARAWATASAADFQMTMPNRRRGMNETKKTRDAIKLLLTESPSS